MSIQQMQVVLWAGQHDERCTDELSRRGIALDAAREHRVGYIHDTWFGDCEKKVMYCFTLPMFGIDGSLLGLKLHRQFRREGQGKAFWLFPSDDCKTLWPPPEWKRFQQLPADIVDWPEQWIDRFEQNREGASIFTDDNFRDDLAEWQARKAFGAASPLNPCDEWLFLCAGELKALAVIGAGLCATAPMTGENNFWSPALARRFSGSRVCLIFDDDEQGRRFRDRSITALLGHAAEVRAVSFGVAENGSKIDANDVARSRNLRQAILSLLESARPIDAEDWNREHASSPTTAIPGVLPAELAALDAQYAQEMFKGCSRADRLRNYGRYLAAYPPAVSGEGGHATLLKAASHRHGFAVPIDDAIVAMREYNLRCSPPWSEGELLHKLEDARPLRAFPPGSRLAEPFSDEELDEILFVPASKS